MHSRAPNVLRVIWIRVGSLGVGRARCRWVHSGGPRGGQVHSGSRGFTSDHLGVVVSRQVVVGFIPDSMVSLACALASSGSF